MPELPEVEVTRLSIADRIAGALILEVRQGKPLRWPLQVEPESLVGRRLVAVRRRGKYLLLEMDQGLLLMHLGMSGSLSFAASASEMGKHDHFDLHTTQGILRLNDPRRFGAVVYVRNEQDPVAEKLLGRLGMEPLGSEFDPLRFFQALRVRKTSIKQILLAGEVVVGVGNIYACEALFLAGIRPTVTASRLSRRRTDRLHHAICGFCYVPLQWVEAPCATFPMRKDRTVISSRRRWSMVAKGMIARSVRHRFAPSGKVSVLRFSVRNAKNREHGRRVQCYIGNLDGGALDNFI